MTTSDYQFLEKGAYKGVNRPALTWGYMFQYANRQFAATTNGFSMNIVREPDFKADVGDVVRFKTGVQPWRPDTMVPSMIQWMEKVRIEPDRVEIETTHFDLFKMDEQISKNQKDRCAKFLFGDEGQMFWEEQNELPVLFGQYTLFGNIENLDHRAFDPELLLNATSGGEWRIILGNALDQPAFLKQDRYSSLVMPIQI